MDFLPKLFPNLDAQDFLEFLSNSYQLIASWKTQRWSWLQTSGPCPDPESQQSNKAKQSMAWS